MKNTHNSDKHHDHLHQPDLKSAAPLKVSDAYYVALAVLVVFLVIY